jgi:hypothetical protein
MFRSLRLDAYVVLRPVLGEKDVGLPLCRVVAVGVIEEVLHAEEDLFDGDGRLGGGRGGRWGRGTAGRGTEEGTGDEGEAIGTPRVVMNWWG